MNARIEAGIVTPATPSAAAPSALPPAVIPRHRGDDPFAYQALRRRAVDILQALSGEYWTDFNYHDPGVTLLDALCYALTEDLFGAQQPLVDLLAAPDGRIHYRRLGLRAAEDILPCRPCTSKDYVLWLLDRVPGARQAHAQLPDGSGLWRLELEIANAQAESAVAAAARAYWSQRNLGEDLAALPEVLRPRWCALQLDVNLEGARAPEDVLAELVQCCAEYIDAAPRRVPLSARLAAQKGEAAVSLADALDGPRLRQGWIDTTSLERDLESRVYFGDLARIAQSVEGVQEVNAISLRAEGLDDSNDALPRRGDDWVLRLRWPDRSEAMDAWRIRRRGNPISIAHEALRQRLEDLRHNVGGRAAADSAPDIAGSALARPQGNPLPPNVYVSLLQQLPHIYRERVDLAGNPIAPAELSQFHAYLALLEQWLAHGDAQTRYLRELYTVLPRPHASYAWQMLGSEHIPGLDTLYTASREQVRDNVFAAADDALDRRTRVLDHLLALYGEGCWQGSIRPFGWYFSAEAWRLHLFEQKRQMLLRIATLTRDRYGAIDYSRRSLGRRGNTPALQQRVSLMLAFKHQHSRLLMRAMNEAHIGLAVETAALPHDSLPPNAQPPVLWSPRRQRVIESMGKDLASAARVLAMHFPTLDPRALPPALLRSAVHAERYRHADAHAIWLEAGEKGTCWRLPLRHGRASAEAAAICLHAFACQLQLECEGMHVIEHVLLRPLRGNDADIPEDFYCYRVTAVFPAWTARSHDPSFRRIAMETLALNAPAHLRVQALWLDAPAMHRFERSYAAWLEAKQAHCAAWLARQRLEPATRRLDDWTRLLRWLLWRHLEEAQAADKESAA